MNTLFTPSDRQQILDRLEKLQPGPRANGERWIPRRCARTARPRSRWLPATSRRSQLPREGARPVREEGSLLGEKPFSKNSPTDPSFVVGDPRDFAKEKARLVAIVRRFGAAGAAAADGRMHSFFGRLTGDEWGVLMYKHLDHHLRQFGA